MSDEQVVGHVGWSPDFKAQPDNKIQKALDAGTIKFEPHYRGDKLVSFDLVAADPEPQDVAPDLRPHREKGIMTIDAVLHTLWTRHMDGDYDKMRDKTLWMILQRFIEANGGLTRNAIDFDVTGANLAMLADRLTL